MCVQDKGIPILTPLSSASSGWRPDPTDKCAQCVKPASAETKSSLYMEGEAQASKTPGE